MIRFIFYSNFLNPHQYPIGEELFRLTGGRYRFIETEKMPDAFHRGGYPDYSGTPWLIRAWESQKESDMAEHMAIDADVMMFGGTYPYHIITRRLNQGKITLQYSERWFKRGLINLLSPRLISLQLHYHLLRYSKKPLYLLCASAFTASDMYAMHSFRDKAFRWGYFPKVADKADDKESVFESFRDISKIRLMYVARFLKWKHPEMPVIFAHQLKSQGIDFELNIFGSGKLRPGIETLINDLNVADCVNLRGNVPNDEIHRQMRKHHILLFTSDRNEGWGAVANEAMANGCTVVGSDRIGSIPYLIRHQENGLIFKDRDQADLNCKVMSLVSDMAYCERLARKAYETVTQEWSPSVAAKRLLTLTDSLIDGGPTPYSDGPCSIAPVSRHPLIDTLI